MRIFYFSPKSWSCDPYSNKVRSSIFKELHTNTRPTRAPKNFLKRFSHKNKHLPLAMSLSHITPENIVAGTLTTQGITL